MAENNKRLKSGVVPTVIGFAKLGLWALVMLSVILLIVVVKSTAVAN